MMTRRSAHDELRREGEARVRRRQEIVKEISGWKHRLETAEQRDRVELAERRAETEEALAEASAAPEEIAAKRAELGRGDRRWRRRGVRTAADALAAGRGALREAADRRARRRSARASEAREARARAEARAGGRARDGRRAAAERIAEEAERNPGRACWNTLAHRPGEDAGRASSGRRRRPPEAPARGAGRGEPARRGRRAGGRSGA